MQVQQEIRRPSLQAMALTLAALAALIVAGLAGYLVRNADTSGHRSFTTSTAQTVGSGGPAVQPGETVCSGNLCVEEGPVQAATPDAGSFPYDPGYYGNLIP
jgi:hypothetical protein